MESRYFPFGGHKLKGTLFSMVSDELIKLLSPSSSKAAKAMGGLVLWYHHGPLLMFTYECSLNCQLSVGLWEDGYGYWSVCWGAALAASEHFQQRSSELSLWRSCASLTSPVRLSRRNSFLALLETLGLRE